MATARRGGGLSVAQGAGPGGPELTSIPLPASARRAAPQPIPAAAPVPAQVGVDALLSGVPQLPVTEVPPLPDFQVGVVGVPLPQPSRETTELRGMLSEAQGALRDEDLRAEAARTALAEQYAAAVAAPLPAMEERPQLPDAPVMRNWQEAVQEQMPLLALIAVLGAAGTRQPLLNAMNAMTTATLALQKGQYDEYERSLRQWEVESKVALDKIQAWQDKRKEILDSRNLSIEQKKAMLEAMDESATKRRALYQGDVERISYWLEESAKADQAIQKALEANAKMAQTAEATNARLGQAGAIADRRFALSQDVSARRDAQARIRAAIDTQRLITEKLRAVNEQSRYASEDESRKFKLDKLKLEIEQGKALMEERKARLKLEQSRAAQQASLNDIKMEKAKLEIANMERAKGELSTSQFQQAKALKKQFDTDTAKLFDDLEAMENILDLRGEPLGAELANNWLVSLAPGRQTTNQQLNAIKNTGDLGTRIQNTYSMFLTGKPGPQAMEDVAKLIRDMAPLYRQRIKTQIERVGSQVQTLFQSSGDDVQLKVFEFIVPETIPGGELSR